MNKKEKTVYEFSAGGVVVDKNKNVLVVRTKNLKGETVYTFPKGHIEKEETPQQAALREVKEETGVEAEIIKEIKDVEYWFIQDGRKVHKKVKWYFMKPVKIQQSRSDEIDEVLWYDIKEVEKILTYNSDKELIKEIIKEIN